MGSPRIYLRKEDVKKVNSGEVAVLYVEDMPKIPNTNELWERLVVLENEVRGTHGQITKIDGKYFKLVDGGDLQEVHTHELAAMAMKDGKGTQGCELCDDADASRDRVMIYKKGRLVANVPLEDEDLSLIHI